MLGAVVHVSRNAIVFFIRHFWSHEIDFGSLNNFIGVGSIGVSDIVIDRISIPFPTLVGEINWSGFGCFYLPQVDSRLQRDPQSTLFGVRVKSFLGVRFVFAA